jgi:hypothetical protein
LFQWQDGPPGCTPFAVHSIPTGDTLPIVQKQYPIPTIAQEPLRKQVAEMLRDNIIRPGSGPWRSPVLLIAKTDSETGVVSYRFCIDLRKVNNATVKDAYSLPRIDESVDVLAGAQFFSSMDINRAFWQVPLLEEDKQKTGFMVEGKLYEFNVMPFGSMNAQATFQRLMDRVLNGLTWKQVLVYLDDVLLFSKLWPAHVESLRQVFNRLRSAKLKLKPSKCVFGTHEVTYLGFAISDKGIRPSFNKVQALLKTERPQTTKLLLSFLCSVNYYRHDIPCFGELTADLYDMANEKKRFCTWTDRTSKNFDILKKALSISPILAFPNFTLQFWFQQDASMKAIGGVCLQIHDIWRPVMFFGRKLTSVERRYSTTERELLSIVYAYKICYHLIFQTDHQPLVTLARLKEPFGRLGRLFHYLVDVDFEIRFIPGRQNFLADFMSRAVSESLDTDIETFTRIEVNSLQLTSNVNWAVEQDKDTVLDLVKSFIKSNRNEDAWRSNLGNKWINIRRQLYIFENVLKYGTNQVVVPQHLKRLVLEWHHDTPFAGHRGADTVLVTLRIRYFWLNMYSDVVEYCKSCNLCQMYNYSQLHNVAPLKPIVVSRSGQTIGIDYIGPFKPSRSGNKYAVLAIDANDKFLMGAATKSCDALTTAIFVMNEVICKHGMVEVILSDQAKNFEADLFKHLCTLLGAHKIRSSPYHAAGNGITERVNKVIKPALAKFVAESGDDWDIYLQMTINAYNTSFHSSIGLTPFEAHFGRPAVTVADVILNNRLPAGTDPKRVNEFTVATFENAEHVRNTMLLRKEEAQKRYKSNYDKNVGYIPGRFKVNDLVKIVNFASRPGHSRAWEQKFIGPFVIKRIFSIDNDDITYELSDGHSSRVVHYNRLSTYNHRNGERLTLGRFPVYENNDNWTLQETTIPLQVALSVNSGIQFDLHLARKLALKRRNATSVLMEPNGINFPTGNIIAQPSLNSNIVTTAFNQVLGTPSDSSNRAVISNTVHLLESTQPGNIDTTMAQVIIDTNSTLELDNGTGQVVDTGTDLLNYNTLAYVLNPQAPLTGVDSTDVSEEEQQNATRYEDASDRVDNALVVVQNDNLLTRRVLRSEKTSVAATSVETPTSKPAKPRLLCIGCKKTWAGLKIHQNTCKSWLDLKELQVTERIGLSSNTADSD